MEIDMASTVALEDELTDLQREVEELKRQKVQHRANWKELQLRHDALREAAMPFVKAGEAFGEVRTTRDDIYLWVQSHGEPEDDVKISLTDCDRLRDACVS